jgi:hypothetical protein
MYPNWDFWFENIPSGNQSNNSRTLSLEMKRCERTLGGWRQEKHKKKDLSQRGKIKFIILLKKQRYYQFRQ